MKRILMYKCSKCGRIKQFDKWVYLHNILPDEVRRNLASQIACDKIDWEFIHCRDCIERYDTPKRCKKTSRPKRK